MSRPPRRSPRLAGRIALALLVAATALAAQPAPRVVAVGDVHGAYEAFVGILQTARLIDADHRWIGGEAVLVQTGDVLDRGPRVREALDLLIDLEAEAEAAGGRVLALLGNHEQMNLIGDFSDVAPETWAAFADAESEARREAAWRQWSDWLAAQARRRGQPAPQVGAETRERWLAEHPLGYFEYQAALAPDGRYGAWLRRRPVAASVGDTLFLHGGISAAFADRDLEAINEAHRQAIARFDAARSALAGEGMTLPYFDLYEVSGLVRLETEGGAAAGGPPAAVAEAAAALDAVMETLAADSPLWFRGYAQLGDEELQELAARLRQRYGTVRAVTSHTPAADGRVRSRLDGAFLLIDTGMLASVYRGRASAVEVDGGRVVALYADGSEPLPSPTAETATDVAVGGPPAGRWLGPDGAALPFASDDEAEAFLRTAEVVEVEDIPVGVTKPLKVLLAKGGVRAHAAFRYHHEERRATRLADGSMEMFFLDSYKNEVAAYELSRLLGLHNLPPVVLREVNGRRGSLQLWIEGAITQTKRQQEDIRVPADQVPRFNRQTWDMDVFDNLVRNIDRNAGNMLWDATWTLWMIDHTRCFARASDLPQPDKLRRISRGLWEALRGLDGELVSERLSPYLSSFQVRSLLARRAAIVERLEARIASEGEAAVIVDPADARPAVRVAHDGAT